ncbi:MAG: hypothetical protein ACXAC7_08395 [Candidatus Hodarchaeales archaeon]|jgi:hypothetical protein
MIDWKTEQINIEPDAERILNEYLIQIKVVLDQNAVPPIKQQKIFQDLIDHIHDFLSNNNISIITFDESLQLQEQLGAPADYADYSDESVPEIKMMMEKTSKQFQCPRCGVVNSPDSQYCIECGVNLVKSFHAMDISWLNANIFFVGIFVFVYSLAVLYSVIFVVISFNLVAGWILITWIGGLTIVSLLSILGSLINFSGINSNQSNFFLSGSMFCFHGMNLLLFIVGLMLSIQNDELLLLIRLILAILMLGLPLIMIGYSVKHKMTRYKFISNISLSIRFILFTLSFFLLLESLCFIFLVVFMEFNSSVEIMSYFILLVITVNCFLIGCLYLLLAIKFSDNTLKQNNISY